MRCTLIILLCSFCFLYGCAGVQPHSDNSSDKVSKDEQSIEQKNFARKQHIYILNEIIQQLPSNLFLTSICKNGINITITGYALTVADAASFGRNLEKSLFLKQIDIQTKPETFQSNNIYGFALTAKVQKYVNAMNLLAEEKETCSKAATLVVDKQLHLLSLIQSKGLSVNLFGPDQESIENDNDELPVRISVTGKFNNLRSFINELNRFPHFALLGDFTIEQTRSEQTLIATITIYRYRYNTNSFRSARKIETCNPFINTNQEDPFSHLRVDQLKQSSKTQNMKKITDFPLNDFRLLGIIQTNKPLAQVQVNNKQYIVKIGDHIGNSNGVITEILSNSIIVREVSNDGNNERTITLNLPQKQIKNQATNSKPDIIPTITTSTNHESKPSKPKPKPKQKRNDLEHLKALQKFINNTGENYILRSNSSRIAGNWSWIHASLENTDGTTQQEPIQALLKKQDKEWKVIYVRPKYDECIKDPDCADDKKMHKMIREKFGPVPMFIFP